LLESPLADPSGLAIYEAPEELLEPARFSKTMRGCENTTRFVLAWSDIRPLDRLLALRGTEAGIADMAAGSKELRGLLGKIHDFYRREIEVWATTSVDGVVLGDLLGAAAGLRIPFRVFRQWIRPLYREYCEILRQNDKFAFFCSEGPLPEVFGELIEAGVDAIHAPLALDGLEKMADKYRNRITFWGGIDQKHVEPPCALQDIRDAVLKVRRALDYGTGGVIAQCQWGQTTPIRNIAAFFEEWLIPLPVNV
jgi:hypothetical protein